MNSMKPKPRFLWCDAEANCERLSTREGVIDLVEKALRCHIDNLIVDVKPLSGEVLYQSRYAPRLGEVKGFVYPEPFDLLQTIIEEARPRGIRVHASINVFSEGHRGWGRGPAYTHPDWQVTVYELARTVRFSSGVSIQCEAVDPWELPGEGAALYTRKLKCDPERCYIVITDQAVATKWAKVSGCIPVPKNGCIVALPSGDTGEEITIGESVEFLSETRLHNVQESSISTWGIFVNPLGPAREYELKVVEEIVAGYEIDGIVFDRMRYPHLYADFSDISRDAFTAWLGVKEIVWPEDVFRIDDLPWIPPVRGRYYKEWLEWRAQVIHDFAEDAVTLVHETRPGVEAGVYVGSWYDSYYDVGVNWGSSSYHAGYEWMTDNYNRTGYAELFDFISTGCYYPIATRDDARRSAQPEGATVEAACELSRMAIGNASPFSGGLYLQEYAGNPEAFQKCVKTALDSADGVMLFDLVHIEQFDWWQILEEMFAG